MAKSRPSLRKNASTSCTSQPPATRRRSRASAEDPVHRRLHWHAPTRAPSRIASPSTSTRTTSSRSWPSRISRVNLQRSRPALGREGRRAARPPEVHAAVRTSGRRPWRTRCPELEAACSSYARRSPLSRARSATSRPSRSKIQSLLDDAGKRDRLIKELGIKDEEGEGG